MRIGLTQRVIDVSERGERVDSLDQRWGSFLNEAELGWVPIPNTLSSTESFLESTGIKGIVISGGNNFSSQCTDFRGGSINGLPSMDDLAPERDQVECRLLELSLKKRIPVIGVCRGLQLLNLFYGGRIAEIDGHVRTRHSIFWKGPESVSAEESFEVNSYHRYGVQKEGLAKDLVPWAESHDGHVEAFRHQTHPHFAMMWHPERETGFRYQDIAFFRKVFLNS